MQEGDDVSRFRWTVSHACEDMLKRGVYDERTADRVEWRKKHAVSASPLVASRHKQEDINPIR